MANSKANNKANKKKGKLMRPSMVVLAIVFLWAAQNMPPSLNAGSAVSWGLGAFTVALLAGAGFALAVPVLTIFAALLGQALREHKTHESEEA
jgi:cell division protein FtsW (lipid II flippase)